MEQKNPIAISLPSDREILITRFFDAPRELVFKAHLDPTLIPLWWGPRTTTTIVERLDAQPGGAYRFVHRSPDGSELVFFGEYREIVPPERIVLTFSYDGAPGNPILETDTFMESNGKTILNVLDVCDSVKTRDAILATGMEEGLTESYERLEALVMNQVRAIPITGAPKESDRGKSGL